jgi:hypothetical protein
MLLGENEKHVAAEGKNAKASLERTEEKQAVDVKNQAVVVKICS